MALPLSNATEDEDEELVHGFDTTGYTELPADHLSDSSESSNASNDALGMSFQVESMETLRTMDAATHRPDGAFNGMEIQAETHNKGISGSVPYQNGGLVDRCENEAATESVVNGSFYQNGNHTAHAGGMENQGSVSSISHVVHIDGMEIHVYGQFAGLQLSSLTHNNSDTCDDEEDIDDREDVDEIERQCTEDTALQRAKEADDARRLAPLPPDRCQAIKKAMQSISLGGFQPEWVDKVPEEQWINRLRGQLMSKSIEK